jgi:hypothetical protein
VPTKTSQTLYRILQQSTSRNEDKLYETLVTQMIKKTKNLGTTQEIIKVWHDYLLNIPYYVHKNGKNYKFFVELLYNPETPPILLEDLSFLSSRKPSPHVKQKKLQHKLENIILYPETKYIAYPTNISKKDYAKNSSMSLYWRENDPYFFTGDITRHPNTNQETLLFITQQAIRCIENNYNKNRVNNRLWVETLHSIARHANINNEIATLIGTSILVPKETRIELAQNKICPEEVAVQVFLNI